MAYLEPYVTLAYSESCLFRHIQAYSDIFNDDSYNNIFYSNKFYFFCFNLKHTCQRNLKRHVFWLQWRQFQCSTESTSKIRDFGNSIMIIIKIQLTFSSRFPRKTSLLIEKKVCYLTKYNQLRSKLVFYVLRLSNGDWKTPSVTLSLEILFQDPVYISIYCYKQAFGWMFTRF